MDETAAEIGISEGCGELIPDPGSNQFILDAPFGGTPELAGTLGGVEVTAE